MPHTPRIQFLTTCTLVLLILGSQSWAQEKSSDKDNESNRARLEQALESLTALIDDEPSRHLHDRAEVFFRLERFEESILDYDRSAKNGWPHDEDSCWERGLAQYYAGDFAAGAKQFEQYHRVGALDIENGLWRLMCIAEDEGIETARATMLAYPDKKRRPFPALLELYMDRGTADAVINEATFNVTSKEEKAYNLFNAHYYLAKYYEMVDQHDTALKYARTALEYPIPHFMYACAQIDAKRLESTQKPKAVEHKR